MRATGLQHIRPRIQQLVSLKADYGLVERCA
jgi:hypothetical protein